ncbi:SpoIVB peptidase [Caldinitratiruptor microaerophilus]|uniref:SpoIVB peptidase n=1 Tax=Caldinitratiruptor microaerophilus TaxID=671077 RepID=A0AA35CIX8_9FIRM|nr:SpoIVB peptidase [Caldinitratiruptor microaerophilus]
MTTRARVPGAARLLGLALILALVASLPAWAVARLPAHLRLVQGEGQQFRLPLPVPVTVRSTRGAVVETGAGDGPLRLASAVNLSPLRLGQEQLDFRLFGWIPFRRVTVDVIPPLRLVPGGHSIGVVMRSDGVLVVGFGRLTTADGRTVQPGRDAGIQVGDVIVRVGGVPVEDQEHVSRLVQAAGEAGRPVELTVSRQGRLLGRTVVPVRDASSGRFRLGLYVQDGAAGVGTLTFYDPDTGRFGALGHVVASPETGQPIAMREGHILAASVMSVHEGRRGEPGEKVATLVGEGRWLGVIERNTPYGIFGRMQELPGNPLFPEPVPVAVATQVHEGAAEIVTVLSGQRLERFSAEILRVNRSPGAAGKNLVIRITDPRLLARTRGIVQGMSGSPILQDGRLVGAVTHVFVSDPSRGYGVLLEWMLQEAGLLDGGQQRAGSGGFAPRAAAA